MSRPLSGSACSAREDAGACVSVDSDLNAAVNGVSGTEELCDRRNVSLLIEFD